MTFRCSDDARERADPLLGTAPPQARWLLVEHPGPWPVSAPFGTELPTALIRGLGHPELRLLLIRPHRRRPTGAPRRWFHCVGGAVRTGTWGKPEDLVAAVETGSGAPYDGPLLLVCTHGVHDVCCAVRGRPVAAALSTRWPERTWECSHLGGDRFAASVMVFPDAACYGGVDPGSAVRVVETHLAGRVDPDLLRGVAGQHPAEQVAVGTVLRRWGPAPITAATPTIREEVGTFAAGRWTVEVAGSAPLPALVRVVVHSSRRPVAQLTCRAPRETGALQWDVETVEELGDVTGGLEHVPRAVGGA